jgi:hypothetical protein
MGFDTRATGRCDHVHETLAGTIQRDTTAAGHFAGNGDGVGIVLHDIDENLRLHRHAGQRLLDLRLDFLRRAPGCPDCPGIGHDDHAVFGDRLLGNLRAALAAAGASGRKQAVFGSFPDRYGDSIADPDRGRTCLAGRPEGNGERLVLRGRQQIGNGLRHVDQDIGRIDRLGSALDCARTRTRAWNHRAGTCGHAKSDC